MEVDEITGIIVDSAFRVHSRLGPGLLESVYEAVLAQMLVVRGLTVERQRRVPLVIDGIAFEEAFVADLIVNGCVVVELKAIEKLAPVHARQLLTYLRLLDLRIGLLINLGGETLKGNVKRLLNGEIPQRTARLPIVSSG